MDKGSTVAVTVLFTDLVGSTELSSRLDRAGAEALRQEHFSRLRGAVDSSGGQEVKNLGDGLMVVFSSPSRALECAVAMQQAIDHHNRQNAQPLAVRIGISTGEAVEEDGDYFGDPVVQAARLCALARGGQILVPEVIRFLIGRHGAHEFVDVGALELKGLPEPVATVEVLWEPAVLTVPGPGRPPFPARLASAVAPGPLPFAGRAEELAVLDAARKRAGSGDGVQTVLIAGEPGMGKTTLCAKAARRAHDDGATVLLATCDEEITVPYQLWIAALAPLLEHGGDSAAGLRPAHAGALARLMPALVDRLPADQALIDDPETARFLLLEAVVALLAAASEAAPVVLVLDDLQWADAASLQVLRHLVGTAERNRVLVLAAYRASDLDRTHPLTDLLADVHRVPSVARLDLAGLDDTAVVGLLESAAGHDVGAAGATFAHRLRRETGGNPFFVAELLRHLGESGMIVQDEHGRYALATDDDMALPGSIRDVVGRRVARLGDHDARILSAAAVVGREFDLSLLARLSATDEDALLDALERAVEAALVEEVPGEPGRHRFVHALVRQTLYVELSATRRQRLHHQVAELLEEQTASDPADTGRLGELARHWQAATHPAQYGKALDYTRRAGDAAMEALAPADAANWYRQALELAERRPDADDGARFELLLRLGHAQLHSDPGPGYETLRQAGDLAERIGHPDLLVRWALTRVPGWRTSEAPDPDGLRRLHQVLALVPDGDRALRARLLAAIAEETDPAEWRLRRQLADRAMAAVVEAGDDAITVEVVISMSFITSAPDQAHDHAEWARRAVALAENRRDPVSLASALGWLVNSALVIGDIDTARRAIDRLNQVAEVYGSPPVLSLLHQTMVCLSMLEGDLPALEGHAEQLLALGLGGVPTALATYGGAMFQLRWAEGRLAEIADLATAALDDLPSYSGFRAAAVVLYCATGQIDRAREVFATESAARFEAFPFDQVWLACMLLFTEAAVALDDAEAQATLYERLVPFADLLATAGPVFYGSMQRPLGLLAASLGRPDEAEQRLRLALEVHRRIGPSYWSARTAVELAEVLLATHTDEALSLLDEARDLAGRGYRDVAARADELAARARPSP